MPNWNWQLKDWPQFTFNAQALKELELNFAKNTGEMLGVLRHIKVDSKDNFLVEMLSNEAVKTTEIEGEYLDRDSVQSSIKSKLGLNAVKRKVQPAEYGIAEMMVDLYQNFNTPLKHSQMFLWHEMIMNGRRDLDDIGSYRTHKDPMQIVSGRLDKPSIHFEAPPSKIIPTEMDQFVSWYNEVHFGNLKDDFMPLAKAGISHFYFETIHPFEDGNGRIGRAITNKSLSISLDESSIIPISQIIHSRKKKYYNMLEKHNHTLDLTDWLIYFSDVIIEGQREVIKIVEYLIIKAKFFDLYAPDLNERQLKVIKRLFEEGHGGFKGGLSAKNYATIASTSASTSTRDLSELVEKKILLKKGQLKGTRYSLNLDF